MIMSFKSNERHFVNTYLKEKCIEYDINVLGK